MSALPESPLGDVDRQRQRQPGNPRMARRPVGRHRHRGRRARPLPARAADRTRAPGRHRHAVLGQHRPTSTRSEPTRRSAAPGNIEIEERLRAYMRWNAMAMVVKANRLHPADGGDLGGHISQLRLAGARCSAPASTTSGMPRAKATAATCSTSRATASPGVYARAYMEGRLSEEQLLNFRQEVDGKGISSYPHPKLMPEFWQFPTVSMGLGPLMAIYQARFLKYLHARGIADTANRKVWVFCGDGEMDEPESLGAIGLAAREKLDNLIFVINCNLQRLDGPVRGNGKIIQELEGEFRGAGWNVIKLLWGSYWDPLLARDKDGALRKMMMDTRRRRLPGLQGQRRRLRAQALLRPRPASTLEMVAKMSDEDIWRLQPRRPRPAKGLRRLPPRRQPQGPADRAADQDRQGLRHGQERRGQEHRAPDQEADRRGHHAPSATASTSRSPTSQLADIPFYKPADDTPEMKYLHERRKALGGYLPHRRTKADEQLHGAAARHLQGRARADRRRPRDQHHAGLRALPDAAAARQGARARASVPILVDEARTFGMEGLFRQIGIYNPAGPEVHAGRQGPGDVLPRGQGRPDPAGGHQRGRRHEQLDRRGDVATAPTTASWCRSTSTTRCSASSASATWPGRPATCRRAASCSAAPRAAPR